MNIDFHAHCRSGKPEDIKAFVAAYESRDMIACLSGGLHYGGHDMVPNEQVIEICKQYPGRLYPMAKIDLWDTPPDPALAHYYAEKGVVGFKFIYPYYPYDHDYYMPLYEEIEKIGKPVLFHTGNYRPNTADIEFKRPVLRNMEPLALDRIARSFQKLNIVMAHLGTTVWREMAAELIKIHANLYTDLAGCGSWMALSAEQLAKLFCDFIKVYDPEEKYYKKLIFGSDSYTDAVHPMLDGEVNYRMKLRKIGITQETTELIMGNTVGKWIGLL